MGREIGARVMKGELLHAIVWTGCAVNGRRATGRISPLKAAKDLAAPAEAMLMLERAMLLRRRDWESFNNI